MVKSIISLALAFATSFVAATAPHESGGLEHIVIFNRDEPIPPEVNEVLTRLELTEDHPDVRHVFKNSAFRGFAASMKSHCLDLLANMTDVSIVERTASVQSAYAIPNQRRAASAVDTRGHAPWGLSRISTAAFSAHDAREMDYTYSFANSDLGAGSDIYIVDTGLYAEHIVFGSRGKQIWSFDNNDTVADGHGTHVAGTAAGETLGVASRANIFGVRALAGDGAEGWSSNVVAGIDKVIQQHESRRANADFKGSVLSIVDINGDTSSFSNTGDCVDVYAPGEDIISAWIGQPDMVNVLSGTSMATPHVTGIVAYAMANATLAGSPGLMKEWVRMQGLPRGDGTVLANNGVWSSAGAANAVLVSPNGIKPSEKRSEDGLTFTKADGFDGRR
ncbi:hypothetical protein WHR41_07638 [Cladosporium halotolerans]|uniref:Peptidase S8/S53 domain-containing protein n=1 Tax=Cladosporium halotolerans TaxID=1052096 RepID=A0AB34KKN0_9PEZI